MGKLCQSVHIRDITVWVTKGFNINGSGIVLNSSFHFVRLMNIDKGGCDAKVRKRMCQQIVAAPVNRFLDHEMAAV